MCAWTLRGWLIEVRWAHMCIHTHTHKCKALLVNLVSDIHAIHCFTLGLHCTWWPTQLHHWASRCGNYLTNCTQSLPQYCPGLGLAFSTASLPPSGNQRPRKRFQLPTRHRGCSEIPTQLPSHYLATLTTGRGRWEGQKDEFSEAKHTDQFCRTWHTQKSGWCIQLPASNTVIPKACH